MYYFYTIPEPGTLGLSWPEILAHPLARSTRHKQPQISFVLVIRGPRLLHDLLDLALIFTAILLVEARGLGVRWGVRVWVAEQRLDGREDRRDIINGAPLILEDVEADRAIGIDCAHRVHAGEPLA